MKIMRSANDHCPLCLKRGKYFKLKIYQINLEEATEMCENIECPFPFVKGVKSGVFRRNIHTNEPQASLGDVDKLPLPSQTSDDDNCVVNMVSSLSCESEDFNDSIQTQDTNVELLQIYNELSILAEKFEDMSNDSALNSDEHSLLENVKTWEDTFNAFTQFDSSLPCSCTDSSLLKNSQYELEHNYCKHMLNTPSCDVSQVMTIEDN